MLMAFHPPLRPTTIAVKAHCHAECLSLNHALGLSMVKSVFDIKTDPFKWSPTFLKQQLDKIVLMMKVTRSEGPSNIFRLNALGTDGPDREMAKLISIFPISSRILGRRARYYMDNRLEATDRQSAPLEECADDDPSPPQAPSVRDRWKSLSWTSLYAYGSERHLHEDIYFFPSLKPIRQWRFICNMFSSHLMFV